VSKPRFPSRIYVHGIRASGKHGANPGERNLPQEFLVDLEIVVEVDTDDLEHTVDYAATTNLVCEVVEEDSYILIETLADAIAAAVFESSKSALEVTATVHKPGAAAALGVDDVFVDSMFPPIDQV
jgi:dihydroneopterin aldolase